MLEKIHFLKATPQDNPLNVVRIDLIQYFS